MLILLQLPLTQPCMSILQQKKQMFEVEIRKKHRNSLFQVIRSNLVLQLEVNQSFTTFIQLMQPVMPDLCVQYYNLTSGELLDSFLGLIMNNQLRFLEQDSSKLNTWFFDCMAVNNLKFAQNMCNHEKADHLFGHFFHSTVQAYEPQFQLYLHMIQQHGKTRCQLIKAGDESPQSIAIEQLSWHENIRKSRAVLGFWGAYIGRTMDTIFIESFLKVLKIFNLFAEYTDILIYQQSHTFICQIFKHMHQLNIFSPENSQNPKSIGIAYECRLFVKNVQRRMPFMFKCIIRHGLNYPQLSEIICYFFRWQKYQTGIFAQTLFLCQNYIKQYILDLLNNTEESVACQKAGLKLMNLLYAWGNAVQFLYIEGVITINRIIANELLYPRKTRIPSAIVLYNAIDQDIESRFLVKILETVEYQELFKDIEESQLLDIYEFVVNVMRVYENNRIIYDKLLIDCELEQNMRKYYKDRNQQKGYELFAKIVQRNIDFFMAQYPKLLRTMREGLDQMDFQGIEEITIHLQEAIAMCDNTI